MALWSHCPLVPSSCRRGSLGEGLKGRRPSIVSTQAHLETPTAVSGSARLSIISAQEHLKTPAAVPGSARLEIISTQARLETPAAVSGSACLAIISTQAHLDFSRHPPPSPDRRVLRSSQPKIISRSPPRAQDRRISRSSRWSNYLKMIHTATILIQRRLKTPTAIWRSDGLSTIPNIPRHGHLETSLTTI